MKDRREARIALVAAWLLAALAVATAANTPPVADFTVHADEDDAPYAVVFDAMASRDADGSITSYQWLFGDGTTGSGAAKRHRYDSVSTYTVTLVVTDDEGASHLITRSIDLTKPLPQSPPAAGGEPPTERSVAVRPANVPVGTRVGHRAPAFALPSFDGDIVRLSDSLDNVVLLEFWSSNCPACISAMARLEALRQTYEERGLVVITVAINSNHQQAEALLDDAGYTGFVPLREADPRGRPTMAAYNVARVPHAFLIDRTGVIRYNGHPSYLEGETIERWL